MKRCNCCEHCCISFVKSFLFVGRPDLSFHIGSIFLFLCLTCLIKKTWDLLYVFLELFTTVERPNPWWKRPCFAQALGHGMKSLIIRRSPAKMKWWRRCRTGDVFWEKQKKIFGEKTTCFFWETQGAKKCVLKKTWFNMFNGSQKPVSKHVSQMIDTRSFLRSRACRMCKWKCRRAPRTAQRCSCGLPRARCVLRRPWLEVTAVPWTTATEVFFGNRDVVVSG